VRWLVLLVVACSSGGRRDAPEQQLSHQSPQPSGGKPRVTITTAKGEVSVGVEVVATDPLIERGMMYREYLPPDAGMLFLMGKDYDWGFYMKNTLIPLDMIFITREMNVAGIVERAVPHDTKTRQVGVPSRYVLEVNGGWAAAHLVTAGARVRFEGVPQ
jgi:uncharacterized membrane protein (UPF0127 family)